MSEINGKLDIDPLGRPTNLAGRNNYFRTDLRPYVPTLQNISKQNKCRLKILIITGGTVGWPRGSLMTHILFSFISLKLQW